jgi:hypothetical protein
MGATYPIDAMTTQFSPTPPHNASTGYVAPMVRLSELGGRAKE